MDRLDGLSRQVADIQDRQRKADELHDALLEVPVGSPKDAQPLLTEVRVMLNAYKRGTGVVRGLVISVPVVGAAWAALPDLDTIKTTVKAWLSSK